MKSFLLFTILFFGITASNSKAHSACMVLSNDYQIIAHVTSKIVLNTGGTLVGYYDDKGMFFNKGYNPVGRVDNNGHIHSDPWLYLAVGRVDNQGIVHASKNGYKPVAHGQNCKPWEVAAAAFLVLFNNED